MNGDGSPLLELRDVARTFGRHCALQAVTLRLDAGETVALFGANGAGKTTLIRIAATLLVPTAGVLLYRGRAVKVATRPEYRRHLGLLGHATFLYDDLTAEENLVLHARLRGIDRPLDTARLLLERVGLAARARERLGTFSRGMQQRTSLARAFVGAPEILLLDEPFSGLDATSSTALGALLDEHRSRGGTALVSTHDTAAGMRLADRYLSLDGGRVRAEGACAALRGLSLAELLPRLSGGAGA